MFLAAPANLAPRESAVRCGGQWWLHRQGSSGEEEDTVRFRKVISSRGREAAIGSGGRAIDERPAYLRSSCSFTRGSWARGAPPPQLTPPRARGRGRGTVERRARSTPRAGGELHEHDSPATARSNKSGGGASLDSRRTVLKFSLWSWDQGSAPSAVRWYSPSVRRSARRTARKGPGFRRTRDQLPPSRSARIRNGKIAEGAALPLVLPCRLRHRQARLLTPTLPNLKLLNLLPSLSGQAILEVLFYFMREVAAGGNQHLYHWMRGHRVRGVTLEP